MLTKSLPANWLDNRKYTISNKVLKFKTTRKDLKNHALSGDSYLETTINYPCKDNITPSGSLDMSVTYNKDNRLWLVDVHELGKQYPVTLTTFLGRPKEIDEEVEQWLNNNRVHVVHELPIGAICSLKNPTEAAKHNRIVVVTEHMNNITSCYNWYTSFMPIYKVMHIDLDIGLEEAANMNEWTPLSELKNGTKIKNGGVGEVCFDDIEIVINNPQAHTIKVQLLLIRLFLKEKEIKKHKLHSKDTAISTIAKIGQRLCMWLGPRFEETWQKKDFFIPNNIKHSEFDFMLSRKSLTNWNCTKATEKICIDYQQSIRLFGKKSIVRKFRRQHGTTFILSNIKITLTYNIKREMMRVDLFIKKL